MVSIDRRTYSGVEFITERDLSIVTVVYCVNQRIFRGVECSDNCDNTASTF